MEQEKEKEKANLGGGKPLAIPVQEANPPWWKFWDSDWSFQGAIQDIFGGNSKQLTPEPNVVNTIAAQIMQTMVSQTQTAMPQITSTAAFTTPTPNSMLAYQQYKTGPLTLWEATVGGHVAENAHQLLLQADKYHFWGSYPNEKNSYPPLAGVAEYKAVPMPTLTPIDF